MADDKKSIPDAGKVDNPPELGKVEPGGRCAVTSPARKRANNTSAASGTSHPTATIRSRTSWPLAPPGRRPPRERHAEYCCLMTGQGNERGAPDTFYQGESQHEV